MKPLYPFRTLLYAVLLSVIYTGITVAQPNAERIHRDIYIMEGILERLYSAESSFPGLNKPEGMYIPGYGVLFKVPESSFAFMPAIQPSSIKSVEINKGKEPSEVKVEMHEAKEFEFRVGSMEGNRLIVNRTGPATALKKEDKIAIAAEFLKDYAGIMALGKQEKVAIQFLGSSSRFVFVMDGKTSSNETESEEFMVSIPFAEIENGKSQSLKKEQFEKKMSISTMKKGEKDVEIFANILQTALNDNDKQVGVVGELRYGILEGVGLVLSGSLRERSFVLRGTAATRVPRVQGVTEVRNVNYIEMNADSLKLAQENRAKQFNQALTDMEATIKQVLLDYGGTLRSLDGKESVLLTLKVNAGVMPGAKQDFSRIELSVKKSVLEEYASRKLSKDKAMSAISIKRV